jgi:hypothetical protein
MSRHRPATYRTLRQRLATLALAFAVAPAVAAPLAAPALSAGQDIKRETGEIVVNGVSTTVVRYTWRDSQGDPRSVSLVPASASTMGYAVQMSHTVIDGVKRTAYLEAMPDGDGGFGYFVSHELYRTFTDASQGTIAARHAEDDSPLGRYLPSSGEASTVGASQATQEFRVLYPRWGTVASIPQPDVQAVSANGADHQKFMLPVVGALAFRRRARLSALERAVRPHRRRRPYLERHARPLWGHALQRGHRARCDRAALGRQVQVRGRRRRRRFRRDRPSARQPRVDLEYGEHGAALQRAGLGQLRVGPGRCRPVQRIDAGRRLCLRARDDERRGQLRLLAAVDAVRLRMGVPVVPVRLRPPRRGPSSPGARRRFSAPRPPPST